MRWKITVRLSGALGDFEIERLSDALDAGDALAEVRAALRSEFMRPRLLERVAVELVGVELERYQRSMGEKGSDL